MLPGDQEADAERRDRAAVGAQDPLNLVGIVLPGPRIPAVATNSVTYTDGAVADPARPVLTA